MSEELERSGSEEQVGSATENQALTEETSVESGETQVEPTPETVSYEEYAALKAQLEQTEEKMRDKSEFITQTLAEKREAESKILELERKAAAASQGLPEMDDYWTGEDYQRKMEAEQAAAQAAELRAKQIIADNKLILSQEIPDYELLKDDIASTLIADGAPVQSVEIFKQNPYAIEAEDRAYIKSVAARVKQQRELEKLKQGASTVQQHVANIQNAAQTTTIGNRAGQGAAEVDPIEGMSAEDIWNLAPGKAAQLRKQNKE